jgi:hypothetical protein
MIDAQETVHTDDAQETVHSDDKVFDYCRDVCYRLICEFTESSQNSLSKRKSFEINTIKYSDSDFRGELINEILHFCKNLDKYTLISSIIELYMTSDQEHHNTNDKFLPIQVADFFYFIINVNFWKGDILEHDIRSYNVRYSGYCVPLRYADINMIKVMKCLSRVASDFLCIFRPISLKSFVRLVLSVYNNGSSEIVFAKRKLNKHLENTAPCVCCAYELNTERSDACVSIMSQYQFGVKRGLHVPSSQVAYQILKGKIDDDKWLSEAYKNEKIFKWLRLLLASDVQVTDENIEFLNNELLDQKLYLLNKVFIQFSGKLHKRLDMDSLVRQGSNSIPFMLQYFYGDGYTDEQLRLFANCASILPCFDNDEKFIENVAIDQVGNRLLTIYGTSLTARENAVEDVLNSFPNDAALDDDLDILLKNGNKYLMKYNGRYCLMLPSEVDHIPDEGRETLHILMAHEIDDIMSVYNSDNKYTQNKNHGDLYINFTSHQSYFNELISYKDDDSLHYTAAILERSITPKILECFRKCFSPIIQPSMNLKYAIVQLKTDHVFVRYPYERNPNPSRPMLYFIYKNLILALTSLYNKMQGIIAAESRTSCQWILLKRKVNRFDEDFEAGEYILHDMSILTDNRGNELTTEKLKKIFNSGDFVDKFGGISDTDGSNDDRSDTDESDANESYTEGLGANESYTDGSDADGLNDDRFKIMLNEGLDIFSSFNNISEIIENIRQNLTECTKLNIMQIIYTQIETLRHEIKQL